MADANNFAKGLRGRAEKAEAELKRLTVKADRLRDENNRLVLLARCAEGHAERLMESLPCKEHHLPVESCIPGRACECKVIYNAAQFLASLKSSAEPHRERG